MSKKNSYVTAASTPRGQQWGYVFKDCKLIHNEKAAKVYLGRPWRPYAKTVFIGCELGDHILKEGWHNWNKKDAEKTSFYAEYGNYGPGAASKRERVKWSHTLSAAAAEKYTPENVLGPAEDWYFKLF